MCSAPNVYMFVYILIRTHMVPLTRQAKVTTIVTDLHGCLVSSTGVLNNVIPEILCSVSAFHHTSCKGIPGKWLASAIPERVTA